MRDLDATQMNQIAYRVGMRADDGTDLGTFATTVMVPTPANTSIQIWPTRST